MAGSLRFRLHASGRTGRRHWLGGFVLQLASRYVLSPQAMVHWSTLIAFLLDTTAHAMSFLGDRRVRAQAGFPLTSLQVANVRVNSMLGKNPGSSRIVPCRGPISTTTVPSRCIGPSTSRHVLDYPSLCDEDVARGTPAAQLSFAHRVKDRLMKKMTARLASRGLALVFRKPLTHAIGSCHWPAIR